MVFFVGLRLVPLSPFHLTQCDCRAVIESTTLPGHGSLHLTGQLGEVISESAELAFAWVKSHAYELGIAESKEEDPFANVDVHIHMPAGSIRKDGPSAGVAMVVAMVSLSEWARRACYEVDLTRLYCSARDSSASRRRHDWRDYASRSR